MYSYAVLQMEFWICVEEKLIIATANLDTKRLILLVFYNKKVNFTLLLCV